MFPNYKFPMAFFIIALFTIVACTGGEMEKKKVSYNNLKDVPDAEWKELSNKKIFFGHQSVGNNILDGLRDIIKEYPQIKLNIIESTDIKNFGSGVLAHHRIGQNTDPESKVNDFKQYIDEGIGKKADIAALKFCYVDITDNTDVDKMYDLYKKEINTLEKKYPDLTVVHFTEPLTVSKTTWKTWIKKILGKNDFWEFKDNVKRNLYNELIEKEYKGKKPLFDIAQIESTKPDGSRQTFEINGKTYYAMVPEYSYDGGHLNEIGRKKVAESFLLFLLSI